MPDDNVTFIRKGEKPAPASPSSGGPAPAAPGGLGLQPVDLCDDPAYADTQYCRLRLPGETPAAFNERWTRERPPLAVTVRRGLENAPPLMLIGAGVVLGVLLCQIAKRFKL